MHPLSIHIGGAEAEFVHVDIAGRSHPEAHDYWDGNWLACRVSLRVGGFRGAYSAGLRADEIAGFLEGTRSLFATLSGSAELHPMEEQLLLDLIGNGRGQIELRGQARDEAGIGNSLQFRLALDQTELSPLIAQLEAILTAYPVIGSPAA